MKTLHKHCTNNNLNQVEASGTDHRPRDEVAVDHRLVDDLKYNSQNLMRTGDAVVTNAPILMSVNNS